MMNILDEILEQVEAKLYHSKSYKPKTNPNGQIDNTQFVMNLKLKKGARVMIISNKDIKDALVNGSLGMILDIKKDEKSGRDYSLLLVSKTLQI